MPGLSLEEQIYRASLRLLARREHSRHELSGKLLVRFPSAKTAIETLMARLEADGFQSDRRFGEAYVRARLARGFGLQRLSRELQGRGLSTAVITEVLAPYTTGDSSRGRIRRAWEKKFAELPQDMREKNKQIRFLRYRGFSLEEIEVFFRESTSTE